MPSLCHLCAVVLLTGAVFSTPVIASSQTENHTVLPELAVQVERLAPVEFAKKTPGSYFVDFGQDSFAGLELTIPNPQPGAKVTLRLGEKLSAPKSIDPQPGGSVRFLNTAIILEAGKETYRVPLTPADMRLMSKQNGPVMPFRYVEIDGVPAGFNKDHIRQLAVHYPFDDGATTFDSSDQKLNAIWKLCHHTMKATSFGGLFIDGDRERKPYEADAYINQLGWYYSTSDITLPRRSWQYLIKHPTWPTEWILFSILMAWTDYQYTGDFSGLKEFYSDLQAKSLIALERPDGLISTVEPPVSKQVGNAIHIQGIHDLVDWPAVERDGYEMKPVNTVVNAFHALALQRMAQIATVLNHPEDALRFEAAAKKTKESLNKKLFDPATGLYVDGEGSHHSSAHANFFPLAFGLVPPERQAKIIAFLTERGMPCSVYAAQFLLESLFNHGRGDEALALMTANNDRSWSHMLDLGLTMTSEAWDRKYKPNQDWNHAWGAAPANLIPRKIMGIEPLDPGFAKILIQPRNIASLQWAEMRVPTVKGSLFVRFDKNPNYSLTVEIPPASTARIGIPLPAPDGSAMVLLDGKPVPGRVKEKTLFLDDIQPGRHTITPPAE